MSKKRLINIFLTLSLFIVLSGCSSYWYKPYGQIFSYMPKGGSPGFELGWKQGCESGLSTQFGNAMYAYFYRYKKDPDIMSSNPDIVKISQRYRKELPINWNNPAEVQKNISDYKKIHGAAYAFCKHSILGTMYTAGMVAPLAGESRWDPAAADIGAVYKIDGRGDTRWSLW